MANYPSPPTLRMAWDRDGSVGWYYPALTEFPAPLRDELNSEAWTGYRVDLTTPLWGIVFPDLRDIYAYFMNNSDDGDYTRGPFQTSPNTTTGLDGTWTTVEAAYTGDRTLNVAPAYRTDIHSLVTPSLGVKGVRFINTDRFSNDVFLISMHVYGFPSVGANPDSLRPWDPVSNVQATGSTLDFGDIPRGQARVRQFRVKNVSATKTAYNVAITMEALTDASPTLIGQFQLSLDGISYFTSINIGNLGPGVISGTIYVADVVNTTAQMSVWAARMVATPTSFV